MLWKLTTMPATSGSSSRLTSRTANQGRLPLGHWMRSSPSNTVPGSAASAGVERAGDVEVLRAHEVGDPTAPQLLSVELQHPGEVVGLVRDPAAHIEHEHRVGGVDRERPEVPLAGREQALGLVAVAQEVDGSTEHERRDHRRADHGLQRVEVIPAVDGEELEQTRHQQRDDCQGERPHLHAPGSGRGEARLVVIHRPASVVQRRPATRRLR